MKLVGLLAVFFASAGASAQTAPPGPSSPAACHEVPEAESHLAVLLSADDVLRVDAIGPRTHVDDPNVPPGEGARIVVAAQPFVTSAWLQKVVDCHVARRAALGQAAGASRSPLDVAGAKIIVSAEPGTLAINIASTDRQAAREVLSRSLALVPAR
jgi:hypothetical protein